MGEGKLLYSLKLYSADKFHFLKKPAGETGLIRAFDIRLTKPSPANALDKNVYLFAGEGLGEGKLLYSLKLYSADKFHFLKKPVGETGLIRAFDIRLT